MTIIEAPRQATGDDSSFDAFYSERYQPMVRVAIGIVDQPCSAEEIVQEALQRVWLRWDDLDNPACYLRTIVVNGCYDELRKRRVRRDADRVIRHSPEAESDYLADMLSSVTPKRRRALVLRYYGGHTLPEIAEAMDIPTGTAKSLIHRGLADLRGALN
ncbi:MAG: sigma-70 family RNA polymerase sigma factor [Actinomycetota bacterium]